MGEELFTNQVYATFAASITATTTILTLSSGDGEQFPVIASGTDKVFRIGVTDKDGNWELMSICRREAGSDTLYVGTCTAHQAAGHVAGRGIEGTTARAITCTDEHIIELPATAAQLQAAVKYSDEGELTASTAEINSVCDGNTATAAEITAVCAGNTATAAEIKAVCDGATVTAAEINVLDADHRTVGDLITKTSADTMGAIAAVAVGQYLKSAGVATKPAWGKLALSDTGVKVGSFSISGSTTTVTGVGFRPSVVFLLVGTSAVSLAIACSIGFDDGTNHGCLTISDTTPYNIPSSLILTSRSISIADGKGLIYGSISSLGADGFTLKFSTRTTTATGVYLALP